MQANLTGTKCNGCRKRNLNTVHKKSQNPKPHRDNILNKKHKN